jgi:hypothetical protein
VSTGRVGSGRVRLIDANGAGSAVAWEWASNDEQRESRGKRDRVVGWGTGDFGREARDDTLDEPR